MRLFRLLGSYRTPAVLSCVFVLWAFTAPASARPAPPCARSTITMKRLPAGPAQYESGTLRLGNGASMRLQGSSSQMSLVMQMQIGDPVAACYGPLKTFADAGPSRSITVLDLKNGAYYATLIGTWPR